MILGIYGAGGLGREVYELALIINDASNRWSRIVFIDDADHVEDFRNIPIYKFTEFRKTNQKENVEVCIAVGEPVIRQILYDKLRADGVDFATLVHPDVSIPRSSTIGLGTIICKFVSITCDVCIGENVYIHPMSCIGHDAIIGKGSVIGSFVDIAGSCVVGENVFLSINVVMKQGISIGDNTIVGLASVVHRDLPSSVIALGNPARPMKNNEGKSVFK